MKSCKQMSIPHSLIMSKQHDTIDMLLQKNLNFQWNRVTQGHVSIMPAVQRWGEEVYNISSHKTWQNLKHTL